ncbi:MAG: OmpA family protein [bacterium]
MKSINKIAAVAAFGLVALSGPLAADGHMVKSYLVDSAGSEVKSSSGECVRWSKKTDDKRVNCGYPAPVAEVVTATQEIVAAPTAATVTTTVDEYISMTAAILFKFDSAELSDDGKAVINERIGKYKGRVKRSMDLEVVGHTDSSGPEAYNMGLSVRRAQAVADYIESQTIIPHNEIKVTGKGESEPVASNDTREGRSANRRVVVHVEGTIIK